MRCRKSLTAPPSTSDASEPRQTADKADSCSHCQKSVAASACNFIPNKVKLSLGLVSFLAQKGMAKWRSEAY